MHRQRIGPRFLSMVVVPRFLEPRLGWGYYSVNHFGITVLRTIRQKRTRFLLGGKCYLVINEYFLHLLT